MIIAQIDSMIETANKGASLGGQALLFLAVITLGYVVISQYRAAKADTKSILATTAEQRLADLRHHAEVVEAYKVERECNKLKDAENFQILLCIAKESAKALQATAEAGHANAAAGQANAQATNSLRETLHGIRDELQASRNERELAKA